MVATCYILFAAEDGSASALARRAIAAAAFCLAHWWVSAGTCGWWPPDSSHGVFYFFHRGFIHNPRVPAWWPGFCMAFDVLAGCILARLLRHRSGFALTAAVRK